MDRSMNQSITRSPDHPITRSWRRRFVLTSRHRGFGRSEPGSAVGAVAEWLALGAAAATQREWTLRNGVRIAVPVDQRDIVAFHQVGTVLSDFDVCHNVSDTKDAK